MSIIENANTVRQRFERTLDAVKNDPTLGPTDRQLKARAAHSEAVVAMERIRQASREEANLARARLYQKAFGYEIDSRTPQAERDRIQGLTHAALDRAEAVAEPRDALKLLERATLTGDTSLVKAIAKVSYERNWPDVLQAVTSHDPGIAKNVAALKEQDTILSLDGGISLEEHYALTVHRPF